MFIRNRQDTVQWRAKRDVHLAARGSEFVVTRDRHLKLPALAACALVLIDELHGLRRRDVDRVSSSFTNSAH
jgi:hypothetical protein